MAFTKLSVQSPGTDQGTYSASASKTDIWAIFRALRDARSLFGLRPGHIQTLQALLSFLKPGHGDTVFASNHTICRRIGGIDERTLRRHINRFVELGFMRRDDSPNRKRYRVTSSEGDAISYGLSLSPLLARASELLAAAQELENARRDRLFLRKKILSKLAHLDEAEPDNELTSEVRRALRRKLSLAEHRNLLDKLDAYCEAMSTAVDARKTTKLPANDGQIVRHHSKSEKEEIDLERASKQEKPSVQQLTAVCDQATSFATKPLRNWSDVENHARTLAPMMGIQDSIFEKAARQIGSYKAACAIFVILQIGNRVRDFAAYFHSVTLGRRKADFDPTRLLERLSQKKIPA